MGTNMIAKLVIYTILLNLSAGILMQAIVTNDATPQPVFDSTSQGGYEFSGEEYGTRFQNELEESIQPAGSLDDKGDQIYRVLDMMSLGFIYRFVNVIDTYMFGFVNIIDSVLGKHLADDVRGDLFGNPKNDLNPFNNGVFKTVITISYILMGISLFTGKDVVEA